MSENVTITQELYDAVLEYSRVSFKLMNLIEQSEKNNKEAAQKSFWELLDEEIDSCVAKHKESIDKYCDARSIEIGSRITLLQYKLDSHVGLVVSFVWRFERKVDRALLGEKRYV